MKRLLAWFALLICLASPLAASDTPFTATLSNDELKAAGIDGLTPEQLGQLDKLVERYKTAEVKREVVKAVKAKREKEAGLENRDSVKRIESRVVGTVDGWSGETTFRLENGQVWKLANRETYINDRKVKNPAAILEKGGFGNYYWLRMEGFPGVRVVRVR